MALEHPLQHEEHGGGGHVAVVPQDAAGLVQAAGVGPQNLLQGIDDLGAARVADEAGKIANPLLLHIAEGLWFTHQFWPLAHNRTRWEGKYYIRAPRTNSERWACESAQLLARNAWLEDTGTMEATQAALDSGVKTKMHLQDEEILVRHGYHALDRFMRSPPA